MNTTQTIVVDPGLIEECSSHLPEQYNLHSLRAVMAEVEKLGLLGRWLYWTELAAIGYQGGAIPKQNVPRFQAAIAFPFHMLAKDEPLILGEYAVEPHQRNQDEGWFRITLHEPNLKLLRPESASAIVEECV